MPEINCRKTHAGSIPPETEVIVMDEPTPWYTRLQLNRPLLLKFTAPRNYEFFKKWWALVSFAFDNWEPTETYGGVKVQKLENTFRKEITIMAGHYEIVCSLGQNRVKKVAKSISWAKMTEDEFSRLYDSTKDVVWERVFSNIQTYSREQFEEVALELSSF